MGYDKVFNKPFIFITGAPRSGTSLVTKIIGAHPDVAMIMENIFGNRRRHWKKADFWDDTEKLRNEVYKFYRKFDEPVLGNKVCSPDVWSFEDIALFCTLFESSKIFFIIRDPKAVVLSRHKRENHDDHFNDIARTKLPFDFSSRTRSFISSWNQSISVYQKLKTDFGHGVYLLYYDDLVNAPEVIIEQMFSFLNLNVSKTVKDWYKIPHYNANGIKVCDLKYVDTNVFSKQVSLSELPGDFIMVRDEVLNYEKFLLREL